MSKYDEIKCPKCLKGNNTDKLEEYTEYGCWSGEEVSVNCLHCDHYFDVSCEHQGYHPNYGDFDMSSFMRVHGIKVPHEDGCSHTWVTHYLNDLVEDGKTTMHVPLPPYENQTEQCRKSYEFAMKEWTRIQEKINGEKDADADEETA